MYADHMKDARFTNTTPSLLAKFVDIIDGVPMEDRDTKGDLYEYMLARSPGGTKRSVPDPSSHHPTHGGRVARRPRISCATPPAVRRVPGRGW